MDYIKETILAACGIAGSFTLALFGGWDYTLTMLILFMGMDYISGLIVAGVFHNSTKTDGGRLESRAGFKGLCRKGMTLLIVLVAAQLELLLGVGYIKDAVIIAYILNEAISLIENAALMGLPVPDAVSKAIELLSSKKKGE